LWAEYGKHRITGAHNILHPQLKLWDEWLETMEELSLTPSPQIYLWAEWNSNADESSIPN